MGIEAVIGGLFGRSIRRVLNVEESPAGTRLPPPDPHRSYLLYLHVPYCFSLCPFCSFHRVEFDRQSTPGYFDSLRREISLVSDAGYRFDELYVGGGTPTVLPDELLRTIDLVRERHRLGGISVETNPDHLHRDKLRLLQDAGVTRLSVGVQSLDDRLLREMQRFDEYGSSSEIRDRLQRTKGIIETVNVDMIFNFPHQTGESLRRDLDILIDEIGVDQVSFYPLMTVESTREKMLPTMGTVDYSREKSLYSIIVDRMVSAGYTRASAWCFSRQQGMSEEYIAGREEFLGLGSGSFSYLQGSLFASTFSIDQYRRLVANGKSGTVRRHDMTRSDQMRYYALMRLFGGALDKQAAEARFDGGFRHTLWADLALLHASGALRSAGDRILLTDRGQYLWIVLMREFFTGVNSLRDQMRGDIAHEGIILEKRANS